ncbi:protein IWS1 homolog [Seriola lalandi dorsalis]|uniref:protein IWS1 homolog n=1 Tax=Seriola lalandi dorsalis TaxID=1841481 RepID=UPI000C6F52E4|nr:protein IWS1 homolog [Seriola lalandi dorsalis]
MTLGNKHLNPKSELGAAGVTVDPSVSCRKMIADIFGESGDEEEEEFTGFNQEDLEGAKKEAREKQHQLEEESDSDEGVDRSGQE